MNRDGFSLLVMVFTGKKALEWKLKYIQTFNEMERQLKERQSIQWQQTRLASEDIRKLEIQGIKELVEYAKAQGSNHVDRYYMVLSKLGNKIVGIEANSRNKVSVGQLNNLMLVEHIICEVIKDGMQKGAYYKDIYAECKKRIEQFRVIVYLQNYKG